MSLRCLFGRHDVFQGTLIFSDGIVYLLVCVRCGKILDAVGATRDSEDEEVWLSDD